MKNSILILISMFFIMSCGSQPESDQVLIGAQNFQYNYTLNQLYSADTIVDKFNATLYINSNQLGRTQFIVKLEGTQLGKTYKVGIYDKDSSFSSNIKDSARVNFNLINAIDTIEMTNSPLVEWYLDSIINNYKGYLTVVSSDHDSLLDKNFLIKGQIGK